MEYKNSINQMGKPSAAEIGEVIVIFYLNIYSFKLLIIF
jgi:hypothetical protein